MKLQRLIKNGGDIITSKSLIFFNMLELLSIYIILTYIYKTLK